MLMHHMSEQSAPIPEIQLRHEVIDSDPPHPNELAFCHTTDLTGNGLPDVIVGSRGQWDNLRVFGLGTRFPSYPRILRETLGINAATVYWYENPGWERHAITDRRRLAVGSALGDINGNGRTDLIAGQTISNHGVYWYEQPSNPRDSWTEHLITDEYEMYHDIRVADIDDDGEPEVIVLSRREGVVFYYDIPTDPTRGPWPVSHKHVIGTEDDIEGATVADVDGDGRTELVAGTNVFHREGDDWQKESIATGWDGVRTAVADLDSDGDLELIFSEGDSPTHGTHPGRVAYFDPPDWEPTFLRTNLFNPHSLQVTDFTGDGNPDIYIGEMGLGEHDEPRHLLYLNRGDGEFREEVVASGIPTHEAKAVDLTGNGRPDIVGKPWEPEQHIDVWYNEPSDV